MARQRKPNYSEAEKSAALELVIACGGNVAEAARRAGIAEKTLNEWVNGRNIDAATYADHAKHSRARVAQRVEALHATKDEVLALLASHLRIDLADLADCFDEKGQLDLAKAQSKGVSRSVKKLKHRATPVKRQSEDGRWEMEYEFTTEIETHDPQGAAAKLINVLGMAKQPDDNPDKVNRDLEKLAQEAIARYRQHVQTDEEALKLLREDDPELASALVQ